MRWNLLPTRWMPGLLSAIAIALPSLTGCGSEAGAVGSAPASSGAATAPARAPGAAPTLTPAVRKRAQEAFSTICATCHGTTGRGDGPAAAGLEPKPRAFGDKHWQASVTDEHIDKVIVFGGPAGGKGANMPAHPMYKDSAAMRAALVELVRAFGETK